MINQMLEDAVVSNYTSFAELFKKELNERLHEAIEGKKQSVIDSTHNMCESCDSEDDEDQDVEDVEEAALDAVGKEDGDVDNDGDI